MTAKARRFENIYNHGLVRLAVCAPAVRPADPGANAVEIVKLAKSAHERYAALVLFPELCLSAYAIDDLLLQDALLARVEAELAGIIALSRTLRPVLVVGAPLRHDGALYNCAVVIHRGRILGVVPKTFLPNYREYYERRHFATADHAISSEIALLGAGVPFGNQLLFAARDVKHFAFHAEVCEDFWAPTPPSTDAALAGATILCNLSASNVTIGKSRERDVLADAQSRRCIAAYAYAAAGCGESTTDLAWDGQTLVYEMGEKLAEGARYAATSQMIVADVDVERIALERLRTPTFRDAGARRLDSLRAFRRVEFELAPSQSAKIPLARKVPRFPFVPDEKDRLDQDCFEAYNIQVQGLATRLRAAGIKKVVIGVSGGLDSTQAILVAARAFDTLGLPRKNIIALTMPGFATSDGTKKNAHDLMAGLKVDARELDIRPAASQMLADIGHPFAKGKKVYDVTFENVQAGLRTDYLFRIANKEGGLVVGTGDLSELALGWCTYGVGDHMSHYNVNASVAKTLIQHLIRWCAASEVYDRKTSAILEAILATEISPELVPADSKGAIQSTEDVVGPYALADFALFHTIRYGLKPSKVLFLAIEAWADAKRGDWPPNIGEAQHVAYTPKEIRKWVRSFLWRFFAVSQFKRTCVPNSPKTTSGGSLSPRGDWRAPSDASASLWLDELDSVTADDK